MGTGNNLEHGSSRTHCSYCRFNNSTNLFRCEPSESKCHRRNCENGMRHKPCQAIIIDFQDPRNLTWIMERGCYICLKRILYHEIFVVQVFLVKIVCARAANNRLLQLMLLTIVWLIFMFVHMNHVLNNDVNYFQKSKKR